MNKLRSEAEAMCARLADMITKLLSELDKATERAESAERALKIAQDAARAIIASKDSIIHNLQKPRQEEREAVATLDSERSANEILTAENDALRTEIATLKTEREFFATSADALGVIACEAVTERDEARAELAKVTAERDAAREYAKEARLAEKAAEDRRIHDTDKLRADRRAELGFRPFRGGGGGIKV